MMCYYLNVHFQGQRVKAVLVLEHHAMRVHVGQHGHTRTQLHTFSIKVLGGVEWLALCSGHLTGGGNNHQYQSTRRLGEPQTR